MSNVCDAPDTFLQLYYVTFRITTSLYIISITSTYYDTCIPPLQMEDTRESRSRSRSPEYRRRSPSPDVQRPRDETRMPDRYLTMDYRGLVLLLRRLPFDVTHDEVMTSSIHVSTGVGCRGRCGGREECSHCGC